MLNTGYISSKLNNKNSGFYLYMSNTSHVLVLKSEKSFTLLNTHFIQNITNNLNDIEHRDGKTGFINTENPVLDI